MNKPAHKQTLLGMSHEDGARVTVDYLNIYSKLGGNCAAHANGPPAVLDGPFTVDELDAIVAWMRNPSIAEG